MAFATFTLCAAFVGAATPADDAPPLPPPSGATSVVRDTCANFWALGPARDGLRELLVLPAQASTMWTVAKIPGLAAGGWRSLRVEPDRAVVVADGSRGWRFDPRWPERGAQDVPGAAPAEPATPWRSVARMPASNHDLTAAVLDHRLYVAGGASHTWGFPVVPHNFDELWELDAKTWTWRAAAKFGQPRIYCATVTFDDRVWIVSGDRIEADGKRRTTTMVEIYDPRTGRLAPGPDIPVGLPAPLALVAGGRLYVMGAANRDAGTRGRMDSIGPGETTWRREADAFPNMWALAGASLDEKIYVCVPYAGLGLFDPATNRWEIVSGPTQSRSGQVAAWRGEVWIMGGTDIADWSETWIFNPAKRAWRRGPALPTPLAWGAAAVVDDQLVVAGGAAPKEGPGGRTYDFSDRTFALSASAIPPAPEPKQAALPSWDSSRLLGTGGSALPMTTERVFPALRFTMLANLVSVPVRNPSEPERFLVTEVNGPIWTFPNRADVQKPDKMLDLPARFQNATHTMAVTFHPRYPEVPDVYVLYNRVQPKPSEDVLARFTVTQSEPPVIDTESEQVLLRWPSSGHNGGDVVFGPDGYLYVSVGDRSAPGDPNNLGQRVDLISGGVLRLDVSRAEEGRNYAIPADNPFVGLSNVRPEFWAYGLRNPWRLSFAPTGELWTGDNGDDSWELVHLVRKGHNYGWSAYEGTHPFKRSIVLGGPTPRLTPPIIELPHSEAHSVIGGFVYRGKNLPGLVDQYFFGDYVTGSMWAFRWADGVAKDFRRIAETRGQMVSFGRDRAGEVLLVRADGEIHRLVAAPVQAAATVLFPRRLSETGIFAATATHTPAPGVLPYAINAPLWSDGAQAQHLLALPGKIAFVPAKENWSLPDGSAVARTLAVPSSMGARRVETQVMYRERGTWRFYTYAWNAGQTDAELIPETGETRTLPGPNGQRWQFASRAECTICHTPQTNFVIGLSTAQFNREFDYGSIGGGVENQIEALAARKVLEPAPSQPVAELPRRADPKNPTLPLEARARAYFDSQCSHCHRFLGVGGRTAFQLLESLPLEKTGLINGRPLVPLLGPEARLVIPGKPEQSEIFHRISLKEGGRMPLIGSQQTDTAGVELIREWILNLK